MIEKENIKVVEKKKPWKQLEIYYIGVEGISDNDRQKYIQDLFDFLEPIDENIKVLVVPALGTELTMEIYDLVTDELVDKLNKIDEKLDKIIHTL